MKIILTVIIALVVCNSRAIAGDSHAGYYYPEPQTKESYNSSAQVDKQVGRLTRIGFTVGLNAQQRKQAYAPRFHIFAKGASSQRLIIVATHDGSYNTLYRLRAMLAALTSDARASPLFSTPNIPSDANFLDICKMLGFEKVTVSDGKSLAHRIDLF